MSRFGRTQNPQRSMAGAMRSRPGTSSTFLNPPVTTLQSKVGNQALAQRLRERLTLSGWNVDAADEARSLQAHQYVLTKADTNPETTAEHLLGNRRYGPYLAWYNGIDPLHWRPGLVIFVPPYIDPQEAERVLLQSYQTELNAIDSGKPLNEKRRRQRRANWGPVESTPNG